MVIFQIVVKYNDDISIFCYHDDRCYFHISKFLMCRRKMHVPFCNKDLGNTKNNEDLTCDGQWYRTFFSASLIIFSRVLDHSGRAVFSRDGCIVAWHKYVNLLIY